MPDTKKPPVFWRGTTEEHLRKVSLLLRETQDGKTNNTAKVTLATDTTTTVLLSDRYSMDTVLILSPKTASAATLFGSGLLWYEATNGRITIQHDSSSATDRTFGAVFVG